MVTMWESYLDRSNSTSPALLNRGKRLSSVSLKLSKDADLVPTGQSRVSVHEWWAKYGSQCERCQVLRR